MATKKAETRSNKRRRNSDEEVRAANSFIESELRRLDAELNRWLANPPTTGNNHTIVVNH